MPAILFGSISTVADTSELQRAAFNQAFHDHGLDWNWGREDYMSMLGASGGQTRIAAYAKSRGESVDAQAVHESKSRIFRQQMASGQITPRPGVVEVIVAAKARGWRLGLVTTTSAENVAALLAALAPGVQRSDFDVVVDSSVVDHPKPDKAAYTFALEKLGEPPTDCVAIEDNPDGVSSAAAAGVPCLAFPNENTSAVDLTAAEQRVDHLDADSLERLVVGRR